MKYWGWFAAKLAIAAGAMSLLWLVIRWLYPRPQEVFYSRPDPFATDLGYTMAVMFFWLVGYGIMHLIVWDQRTRCRTCLRRLRMPVLSGSWSNMLLFGKPRTEYICIYGHGTLRVPQVELTGSEPVDWQPHGNDIWKELESIESGRRER